MSTTSVVYSATAGQTSFDVTFPYVDRGSVVVERNGAQVPYTWQTATRLTLTTPAALNDKVIVRRATNVTPPAVVFADSSIFTAVDLNAALTQLRYRVEETDQLPALTAPLVTAEGLAQIAATVVAKQAELVNGGNVQAARLVTEGNTQDTRLITAGNTQVARVTAEGEAQRLNAAAVFGAGDYASNADALSSGVSGLANVVPGTGGTDGTFALAFTGGGGTGAAGVFTVAGGAVVYTQITATGRGYTSAPTVSFAASAGCTATATAVRAQNRPAGTFWRIPVTGGFEVFENVAGTATSRGLYPAGNDVPCTVTLSNANVFSMTPTPGHKVRNADQVFHGFAAGSNTGAVSVTVVGINGNASTPVVMPNGDPLGARQLLIGYPFAIRFSTTLGKFVLVSHPGLFVSRCLLKPHASATGLKLAGIVANAGERLRVDCTDVTFEFIATEDKPFGSASVDLYGPDGTTPIVTGGSLTDTDFSGAPPAGAWKKGDIVTFRRRADGIFYLVAPADRVTLRMARWVAHLFETGQLPSAARPVIARKVGPRTWFVDVRPHDSHYDHPLHRRSSDIVRFVLFDMGGFHGDTFAPCLNSVFSRFGGHWTHHTNLTFDEMIAGITVNNGQVPSTFESVMWLGDFNAGVYEASGFGHNYMKAITWTLKGIVKDASTGNVEVSSAELKDAAIGAVFEGIRLVSEAVYWGVTKTLFKKAVKSTYTHTFQSVAGDQCRIQVKHDFTDPGLEVTPGINGSYNGNMPFREADTVVGIYGTTVGTPFATNLFNGASQTLGFPDKVIVWDSASLRPQAKLRLSVNMPTGYSHKENGALVPHQAPLYISNFPDWGSKVYAPLNQTGVRNMTGKVMEHDYGYSVIHGNPK